MKKKNVCTLLAGIINAVFAVLFTVGIVVGLILCISLGSGIDSTGGSFGEAMAAVFGALVLVIIIIALAVMILPCICTIISSIGLIKRAVKDQHPKGHAVLSIVIHSLMIVGYLIGIVACLNGEVEVWATVLIIIGLLLSVAAIIFSRAAISIWNKTQSAE